MWQRGDVEQIVVPLSGSKLTLMLFGCMGFVALGLACVFWPGEFASGRHSEGVVFLVGLACVPFFGLPGVWMLWRLFRTRPALTIDSTGIDDTATPLGVGKLLWSEIDDIVLYRHRGHGYVGIEPKEPHVVLRRANPVKALFLRASRLWGAPLISIPETALYISAESLHTLLTEQWERNRASGPDDN